MLLLSCEINFTLTCSANCVICQPDRAKTFGITDTTLIVPAVTLSTQDNTKLLKQLKSGFERTINWKNVSLKYQRSEVSSFQGVNRLFVLSFEDFALRMVHSEYILP